MCISNEYISNIHITCDGHITIYNLRLYVYGKIHYLSIKLKCRKSKTIFCHTALNLWTSRCGGKCYLTRMHRRNVIKYVSFIYVNVSSKIFCHAIIYLYWINTQASRWAERSTGLGCDWNSRILNYDFQRRLHVKWFFEYFHFHLPHFVQLCLVSHYRGGDLFI